MSKRNRSNPASRAAHRIKMAAKKLSNERRAPTRIQQQVENLRRKGQLKVALMNISYHPKGQQRTRNPDYNL
jgi:hypothetical protein